MSARARASVIALPVIGALFGSEAFQLGQMIVRGFNFLEGLDRNIPSEVQAGLLAIGVGILVIVAATSALSRKKTSEADEHLIATVTTTVVAGAFSVLKEAQDPALVGSSWMYAIFVAAVVLLFVVPTFTLPAGSIRSATSLYGRAAAAALAGLLAGAIIQIVVVLLPRAWFPPGTVLDGQQAGFFQVAPIGIGLLLPAWCIVTFDPMLRRRTWKHAPPYGRSLWMVCYAASAIALAWLYGLASNHQAPVVLLLVLPCLLTAGAVLAAMRVSPSKEDPTGRHLSSSWAGRLLGRARSSIHVVWQGMVLAGFLAAVASLGALHMLSNTPARPLLLVTVFTFVISHAAAAASAVFAFGMGSDISALTEWRSGQDNISDIWPPAS
jgi:hypothetical protein